MDDGEVNKNDYSENDKEGSDDQEQPDEESEDDGPKELPDSLNRLFSFMGQMTDYTLTEKQREQSKASLFNKVSTKVDTNTNSDNL